jgi:hypothetical protein
MMLKVSFEERDFDVLKKVIEHASREASGG